jgi:ribulose-bisphosphate carboxylase large chain
VIESARAILAPLWPDAPMSAMPVFSSGQTGVVAAATYAALGCTDLIFAAGGGIFGHPHGVAAGVSALRQSWDAAVEGLSLETKALACPELQAALSFWPK